MIYRIAEAADWAQAQQTGAFTSADLRLEGFIHCSEKHQVLPWQIIELAHDLEAVGLEFLEDLLFAHFM